MAGCGMIVTEAVPFEVGDAVLVARTVTTLGFGTRVGGTYSPALVIVHTIGSPPATLLTLQDTPAAAPVTVALNCWVWPTRTVADEGLTDTVTPFWIAAPELGSIRRTVASTASKFEPSNPL